MAKKMKQKQCIADIPSLSRRLFTVIIMMVASVLCTEAQTLIDGLYYNLLSPLSKVDSDMKLLKLRFIRIKVHCSILVL